jgi:hypothetical protein
MGALFGNVALEIRAIKPLAIIGHHRAHEEEKAEIKADHKLRWQPIKHGNYLEKCVFGPLAVGTDSKTRGKSIKST